MSDERGGTLVGAFAGMSNLPDSSNLPDMGHDCQKPDVSVISVVVVVVQNHVSPMQSDAARHTPKIIQRCTKSKEAIKSRLSKGTFDTSSSS